MDASDQQQIGPQPGPQTAFLATSADIAIYGGSAGGGKSWALLAEPLRHVHNPGFGFVIFRRNTTQVRNQGGLWDASRVIYPLIGADPRQHELKWLFPSGAKGTFAHLEYDTTVLDWQGSEIPYMGFDELTHFSEYQFFYMLSRSRSTCGVRPYIRATTNPDADSWVAGFIAWWIDQETGYAIPERSGVIRWLYRENDTCHWYGSREEAEEAHPHLAELAPPKSVTFIRASLEDNAILLSKDPGYMANLLALDVVERERLLGGNWKIRNTAGTIFKREWMTQFLERLPDHRVRKLRVIRYWDQAGSVDGDESAGGLIIQDGDRFILADLVVGKWTWEARNDIIEATMIQDMAQFPNVELWVETQFANKENTTILSRRFRKYNVRFHQPTKSKIERARGLSSAFERGEVWFYQDAWNRRAIDQLLSFPPPKTGVAQDDIVDCFTGGYNRLLMLDEVSNDGPTSTAPTQVGASRPMPTGLRKRVF